MNTDVSRVHFNEDVYWGTENKFKVLDEYDLERSFEYADALQFAFNDLHPNLDKYHAMYPSNPILHNNSKLYIEKIEGNKIKAKDDKERGFTFILERSRGKAKVYPAVSVGSIKALYRSIRENYDYWLRHEEANGAYWREMEIQRKYKEVVPRDKIKSKKNEDLIKSKKNGWVNRNFSLTGLYRRVSNYGLDYLKPIVIAALAIALPVGWEVYGVYNAALTQQPAQEQTANKTVTQPAAQEESQNRTKRLPDVAAERLAATLGIKPDELMGYFARAIAFSILGVLAIAALKNKFERKSRK